MRFQFTQLPTNYHTDIVTCCCWTPENDAITCSDDQTIVRWRMDGEVTGKIASVDTFITSIDWVPSIGGGSGGGSSKQAGAETFAISCTDGTFRLMNQKGREEKKIEASKAGALICLKWNYDGTALATTGEDGQIKIWSRNGNLRSTLASTGRPVYAVCWGPDNDQLLFTNGENLVIKTIQVGRKDIQWKAHEGSILCFDWNPINNRIISGGEDRIYRVWDAFGRQLYQSPATEHVITSIAWCPNGETFAVGSYQMLRLCDKTGWSYCRERPKCGSLMDISWASDSTQLIAAGGNGATLFAQVIERILPVWKNKIEIKLIDPRKIHVHDLMNETLEEIDFVRDRVIEMSFGYGILIVCTATQCFIYHSQNWNTPYIFDLKTTVNLILQSECLFLTVDNLHGIQVYSYEGKIVFSTTTSGSPTMIHNRQTISLSNDTLSILDHQDQRKSIRSYDIYSGKQIPFVLHHTLEIVELCLNHDGPLNERKIFFIDRNRDLFLSKIIQVKGSEASSSLHKIGSQIDTAAWNDTCEILLAIGDGKLLVWNYPSMIYVDKTLMSNVLEVKDGNHFFKMCSISSFVGTNVMVRRADGTLLAHNLSFFPLMLYEMTSTNEWEKAVRLCRFVKNKTLWTCLAGMAINRRHLETAEIALAAIDAVDKLHFILYVKRLPLEERKNAELALFNGKIDEAETILLQATPRALIYRAIKLNIRLFRWERALDLAIKYTTDESTHVDTVLAYRERFLAANKLLETNKKFLQYAKQVTVDWEKITLKKEQEREKEIQQQQQQQQMSTGGGRRK